jgi:hypothetical protein
VLSKLGAQNGVVADPLRVVPVADHLIARPLKLLSVHGQLVIHSVSAQVRLMLRLSCLLSRRSMGKMTYLIGTSTARATSRVGHIRSSSNSRLNTQAHALVTFGTRSPAMEAWLWTTTRSTLFNTDMSQLSGNFQSRCGRSHASLGSTPIPLRSRINTSMLNGRMVFVSRKPSANAPT